MPIAEIAAGITSLNAAMNIAKAMVGLRDAALLQERSIELRSAIADALDKLVDAKQAELAQTERIHALETELAGMKEWKAEKGRYELRQVGRGMVAYMLKPDARGSEPPHWLCPNCYANDKKSFFQSSSTYRRDMVYSCQECRAQVTSENTPEWLS